MKIQDIYSVITSPDYSSNDEFARMLEVTLNDDTKRIYKENKAPKAVIEFIARSYKENFFFHIDGDRTCYT